MGSQCYLPPDRGDRPAFTPTGQVGSTGSINRVPSWYSIYRPRKDERLSWRGRSGRGRLDPV